MDKRTERVEVSNEDLAGYKLGDEVTITLKGLVKTLEMGSDPARKSKYGGHLRYPCSNIEIEVTEEKISKVGEANQFEKLVELEDDLDDKAEKREKERATDCCVSPSYD